MVLVIKRSSRVVIIWSQRNYWVMLVMLCVMLGKYLELLSVSVMFICLIDDWLIDWVIDSLIHWLSYNYYYTGLLPGRVTYVIGKLWYIIHMVAIHVSSLSFHDSYSCLIIIIHHHQHHHDHEVRMVKYYQSMTISLMLKYTQTKHWKF